VVTIYREQVQERQRQIFVESEMRSAREIQSVLVPEETPAVPGFAIGSLYWPAGEVGGDMFQVLPGSDGDVLIVIADVSGKGLKAAMTVSLLVGTVRTLAAYTRKPIDVLTGMNERLMGRSDGGFSTCLILHITCDGEVTMANAGHIAPFVNGEAFEMHGSLPLGLVANAEFSESRFRLNEGDDLAVYTDGVLEAQNEAGELFGFERCASLMRGRPSVQEIAEAARAFGQEDDITVVKIVRVAANDAREGMSVDLRTAVSA
jgi:serine phosphatase RsbU (regulator of sigma subunit)